tara:strand:- start:73 stop:303 length:231 start_codon:yes stop_codon:yes gene_type:complete
MNYEINLKEKQVKELANLASIAGSLDDLRAEVQKTNIPVELAGITNSVDAVADQIYQLNKTMTNIAESLRVIKYNK